MVPGGKYSWLFFWLCPLHMEIRIKNCWNLFETGHGKGEHDGAGACIK